MESLLFVILAPLATVLTLIVALVAWRRRGVAGSGALVAFSIVEAGWLVFETMSALAPTPAMAIRMAQATLLWAPLLTAAWVAFVLSYTERLTPRAKAAVAVLAAWCLVYGVLALTNDAHRLVWSTWEAVPDGAFFSVTYTLGTLGQVQTGFAWLTMTVSFGVILWAYAGTGARTRDLSRWIVAGALVPLILNVVHLLGLWSVTRDFTPIAMGVSSAAFALGLVRYQFLDLRPIARATLVDDLREGMLVLDADGRVADVNPSLRRALGDQAAVLGRPLRETAPTLADAIDAAPDATVKLGDGDDTRFMDLRVSPLTDRTGTPSGRLVLLHDVTRRRQEQAALRRANADLYDANKELQARNDELDAFAHTVAHDLKNSIQGVSGWAEILRDEGPSLDATEHRAVADDMVEAATKMGTIVHELLLLAGVRQSSVTLRPVEMGPVVQEALGRVGQVHTLGIHVPTHWPIVTGHAPWVEEIWVNFLGNAAKYGGSTVTIGADASSPPRFWVHDDGPGIPADAQASLFVPFTRVGTQSVDGHGLGLSIVRRIVERLGGTCGVESAPGAGTRFWFALPCAGAPAEVVAPVPVLT